MDQLIIERDLAVGIGWIQTQPNSTISNSFLLDIQRVLWDGLNTYIER